MAWDPNAVVTIDGLDLTGNTLSGLSINYGRPTIWDQSRASYASISILNSTNTNYNFEINDPVTITIEDSSGSDITVFTGVITEISNEIAVSGSSATVAVQTITAVGPFAQMSRTIIGNSNWPQEYDDDRLNRIFTDAGVTIDVVDTPGVYEFTGRDKNPQDAYSLAASYAAQALGYIYETKTGTVGYANESRRTLDVTNNGYLNIDKGYINWRGINSRKSISDILNRVILFYKNNAEVTSEDTDSITQYGLYEGRIDTELENMDEAQNIAERFVGLRSIPETNFSSFNINLDNPNITSGDLDDLININMGTAFEITNLPNPISPITYKGFVEGWSLIINERQALLNIISSDSAYSVVPIRWQDVDPLTEWDDIDPTATKTTKTNYVKNPSFEVDLTNYVASNGTLSRITTDSYIGSASCQIVSTVTGNFILNFANTAAARIFLTAPVTVTAAAYVKNTVGTRNLRARVITYATATTGTASESFTGTSVTNPTNWTKVSVTANITSGNYIEVFIDTSNNGAIGDTFLVDAIILEIAGSNTFYWDGSNSDIPVSRRPTLAWSGVSDNSDSTATAYFATLPTTTWNNVDTVGLP